MKSTIQDVAREAGVSIATVSHVINKTRYVSPELVKKVTDAIYKTNYNEKITKTKHGLHEKIATIAFLIPDLQNPMYLRCASVLSQILPEQNYALAVFVTRSNFKLERQILNTLMADSQVAGIICVPVSESASDYSKLLSSGMPFLSFGKLLDTPDADCVLADNGQAFYQGMVHLVQNGHENIDLLLDDRPSAERTMLLDSFQRIYSENKLAFHMRQVVNLNVDDHKSCEKAIRKICQRDLPSAFFASSSQITAALAAVLKDLGLKCPQDVSVVGVGENEWNRWMDSDLTYVKFPAEKMSRAAADVILHRIRGEALAQHSVQLPSQLIMGKSTQMVGKGPFSGKAISPDELVLTSEEIEQLQKGHFKVGISFHYTGTAWANLHETAIRHTLESIGVTVVSVTDAHFDPELQITQLDSLLMQKPDAIIAIPTDDKVTSKKFHEISDLCKLIFISSVPEGLEQREYCSCITVNERENGYNAGALLGEYFQNRKSAKVAFINHGAIFYGTHLRDKIAEQTLRENYPQIEIVETANFYQIDRAYDVGKRLLETYPDLDGFYISWERPALQVIRAIKELHREKISIVCCDLDTEIATYLSRNEYVRGLSTQRPYEQGIAVALATAKALLGKEGFKYIGVPPRVVKRETLEAAWKDVIHKAVPEEIANNLRKKIDI